MVQETMAFLGTIQLHLDACIDFGRMGFRDPSVVSTRVQNVSFWQVCGSTDSLYITSHVDGAIDQWQELIDGRVYSEDRPPVPGALISRATKPRSRCLDAQ